MPQRSSSSPRAMLFAFLACILVVCVVVPLGTVVVHILRASQASQGGKFKLPADLLQQSLRFENPQVRRSRKHAVIQNFSQCVQSIHLILSAWCEPALLLCGAHAHTVRLPVFHASSHTLHDEHGRRCLLKLLLPVYKHTQCMHVGSAPDPVTLPASSMVGYDCIMHSAMLAMQHASTCLPAESLRQAGLSLFRWHALPRPASLAASKRSHQSTRPPMAAASCCA